MQLSNYSHLDTEQPSSKKLQAPFRKAIKINSVSQPQSIWGKHSRTQFLQIFFLFSSQRAASLRASKNRGAEQGRALGQRWDSRCCFHLSPSPVWKAEPCQRAMPQALPLTQNPARLQERDARLPKDKTFPWGPSAWPEGGGTDAQRARLWHEQTAGSWGAGRKTISWNLEWLHYGFGGIFFFLWGLTQTALFQNKSWDTGAKKDTEQGMYIKTSPTYYQQDRNWSGSVITAGCSSVTDSTLQKAAIRAQYALSSAETLCITEMPIYKLLRTSFISK